MILITGCTGYIGSRLCRHLLINGYKVRGLIRPSERERANSLIDLGLIPYYGDLADPLSLHEISDDIDLVYHLAGIHSTYSNTYTLYVQGTINLLNSFSNKPRASIVFTINISMDNSLIKNVLNYEFVFPTYNLTILCVNSFRLIRISNFS